MRFVVLIIGFIGSLLTGVLAYVYFAPEHSSKLRELGLDLPAFAWPSLQIDAPVTSVFLFVAAAYGMLGAILAVCRCGWQGALLLFIPVPGPALVTAVEHTSTLPMTALQGLAGVLSLFVRPVPIAAPAADGGDE